MTATAQHQIKELQEQLADLDQRIKQLQAERAPRHATRKALQEQLAPSDETIRYGGSLSDSAKRERGRINEQIARVNRDIAAIDDLLNPLQQDRHKAANALAEALKPPVTPQSLQAKIDAAQAKLTALQAKRPGAHTALAAALSKRTEVESLEQIERDAEDALKDARAEAFMAPTTGKKRDAANDAITAADMALSVAREKADTGRAAMSRIEQLIQQCREDLDSLDAEIQEAQSDVTARQQAKDLHAARAGWNAAVDALLTAGARFKELDSETFYVLRDGMRHKGVKAFDARNRLDTPQGLKWGEEFVL